MKKSILSSMKGFFDRKLLGHVFVCPFCNRSAKTLSRIGINNPTIEARRIVGAGERLAGCPRCGSSDRERLVYLYLREVMQLYEKKRPLKILHFAPENNLSQSLAALASVQYESGDLFAEGYQYPPHVKNMDVTNIPFDDNIFDLVVCNHVLEHVPNDLQAIRELRRVLAPEGTAIVQVPLSLNSPTTHEDLSVIDPDERENAFGQNDHVRLYGQDYDLRLKKGGFKVQRLSISERFSNRGLNPLEDLFICTH